MKIIDVNQIRELDKVTVEKEKIFSIDLMERAAQHCVNWLTLKFKSTTSFYLFCGMGNNGGDGLAIARLLADKGFFVEVFIVEYSKKYSLDYSINYKRLTTISAKNIKITEISNSESLKKEITYREHSVLIDALVGSGLNKVAKELLKDTIDFMNLQPFPIIAIDVPSGLFCDQLNEATDPIIHANYTLSFQLPKLSFMFIENAKYIGEFSILDINLNAEYLNDLQTNNYFSSKTEVQAILKIRNKVAHKGNFGHALIIAGSRGKMGAAVLSLKACLRSGVGLLTARSPGCGLEIIQNSIPEAMVSIDSEAHFISEAGNLGNYHAIGIGPGIGIEKQTQNALKMLIQNTSVPIVLDADAINILAENKTWIAFLPKHSILTPHLKEFERLTGRAKNSWERIQIQREFSVKNSIYIILKGAHSSISCPNGDIHFNSTGNPGMATAGSGDVLTGILTSLLAQGYTSFEACLLGVYMHGLSGDFASHKKTEEGMIASDIIENLPEAFHFLKK